MLARIKICGVNDASFAVEAERLGADYLGFIFAEGSPRRVTADFVAAARRRLRGEARCVGVFTDGTIPEIVVKAQACGLEIVQLHRRASAPEVSELRAAGFEVWTLAGGAAWRLILERRSPCDTRILAKCRVSTTPALWYNTFFSARASTQRHFAKVASRVAATPIHIKIGITGRNVAAA